MQNKIILHHIGKFARAPLSENTIIVFMIMLPILILIFIYLKYFTKD